MQSIDEKKSIEADPFYQKVKADRIKSGQNVGRLCMQIAYYFEQSKISVKKQSK